MICKWYDVCPVRYYTEIGKIDSFWVDNYCLIGNTDCVRYKKEENGEYHSDKMLPNGLIDETL